MNMKPIKIIFLLFIIFSLCMIVFIFQKEILTKRAPAIYVCGDIAYSGQHPSLYDKLIQKDISKYTVIGPIEMMTTNERIAKENNITTYKWVDIGLSKGDLNPDCKKII